jgi:hypothetical protein
VQTELKLDPHSGVTVIFRSKRGDRLKILVWDGTGMVLIRPLTDQNPLAHSLRPIDMTRHGWLSSRRQASQQ